MVEQDVETLKSLQNRVADDASRVLLALGEGCSAYIAQMARLRRDLQASTTEYRSLKTRLIIAPLLAGPAGPERSVAVDLKTKAIAAHETFRSHMDAWPIRRIEEDWASYKVAARLMIHSLQRSLAEQSVMLAQLIK